jgi:tetratricopeptide (TPR) repeat protein
MNRIKLIILLASFGICIIAIGFAKPSISSYIYITKANKIIDQLMKDVSQPLCLKQLPEKRANQIGLKEALSNVEQALHLDPGNTLALKLSGQIYCLSGEYQNAVLAFNKYLEIREKDPLIHLETGLAELNWCCNSDQENESSCESAAEHLNLAGVSADDLLTSGISAYQSQQYQASLNLLKWNTCLGNESDPSTDLMVRILGLLTNDNRASSMVDSNEDAIIIESDPTIQEDQLYWLRVGDQFGKPLDQVTVRDSSAGVMWAGGPVGAIIYISGPGQYNITMRVLDTQPSPLHFRIEHNLSTIQEFELAKGDNTWKEVTTQIDLEPGYHLIGVEFLNDGIVNEIDRNLYIDGLIVKRVNNK